jgi:hypothetical protein
MEGLEGVLEAYPCNTALEVHEEGLEERPDWVRCDNLDCESQAEAREDL